MNEWVKVPSPPEPLEIEESNARSVRRIKKEIDTLNLCNSSGKEVDESALTDALARIAGIERIKSLIVEFNSRVKDLRFLRALPGLETLDLYGHQLRSLDGLEWFRRGRYINIETNKNRSRNIEKIAETRISRMNLEWANPGDLEAIGRSSTIRELLLTNCPRLTLEQWKGVPITYLGLWRGVIDELADTSHVSSLRDITICNCRKLKRFAGDNSNVKRLIVQYCNNLDLHTIATFRNLEHLTVVKTKKDVPLSAFARLGRLKFLSLQKCSVKFDMMDLKKSATRLKELYIMDIKKDHLAELGEANRGVRVSSDRWEYKDGNPVARPALQVTEPAAGSRSRPPPGQARPVEELARRPGSRGSVGS